MSGDPLRAAVERAARELQNLVSKYTRAPGENGDRVADLLSGDAYRIGSELKDALAEHPAPESPSDHPAPSDDVTREELAETLASISHKRGTETFGAYDRRRADAILARFHVTRRADA